MADTSIAITAGTGTAVDTRTEATNGNHRQVIVIGDPSTNSGIAPVDGTAGLKVDLGADNDISGTVTANLSATDNAVLDAIQVGTDKIPAQGQALAASSLPVVLTAAQITTLTPPAAITGYATSAKQDTIDTSINTLLKPASTLAGVTTVAAVTAITNALPAGTNAIGKLAANSGVDIGDVTLTAGTAAIGTLLPPDIDITTHTNYAKKYYTNAGAVTDGIVWSPAAGKRWHVVSLFVNVSATATVTFEDDLAGGDSPILKLELAANSGTVIPFPEKYPLASGEDAADLIVTTSAGNIYITCVGYEI